MIVHTVVSLDPVSHGLRANFKSARLPGAPWLKFYDANDTGWSAQLYLMVHLGSSPLADTIEHPEI